MKYKLLTVFIALLFISTIAILGLLKLYNSEKAERKRFSDNYTAILTDKAKQQELTFKELKTLYPKYDSIAKELSIKTKNITNIIETRYRFRDTIITKNILKKDSISEKRYFSVNAKCYSISGYVNRDTIAVSKKELNDNLITFLYKDWQHRYFFNLFRTKPFYTAKTYSECMHDTVSISKNIKIIKH
ncbi:MAG: DUF6549 family protein [Bacteroidales bacterium]|jgi:hypothetical protein